MFRFKEGVTPDQVEHLKAELDRLPGLIPQVVEFRFGADLGLNEGNFDMVVTVDFATTADYLTYRDHPFHRRVVTDVLAPLVSERTAVQFGW